MKRGDVVLVFIPFVGVPGGKTRPAVIVQNDDLNRLLRETIIVEVTSNLSNAERPHQVLVDILAEGVGSGLIFNSAIRCERVHTIPQSSITKSLGALNEDVMRRVDAALQSSMGIVG